MKITGIEYIGEYIEAPEGCKVYVDDVYLISFKIQQGQECCEEYGLLTSEDDVQSFIGAELLDITITQQFGIYDGEEYITQELNEFIRCGGDTNVVFITFETSNGPLQFVFYNIHNGWYGHSVTIFSDIPGFESKEDDEPFEV
jgi:hypothetical protein